MAKKRQKQNTEHGRIMIDENKRLEKERIEKERLEEERLEEERKEKVRVEKERLEKERQKREHLEKLKLEHFKRGVLNCKQNGNGMLFFVFWCRPSLNFFIIPFCGPNEKMHGTFTNSFYQNVIFPIISGQLPSDTNLCFPEEKCFEILTEDELVEKLNVCLSRDETHKTDNLSKEEMLQILYMKYIRNGQMIIPMNMSCSKWYEYLYLEGRFDGFISTLTSGDILNELKILYGFSHLEVSHSNFPGNNNGVIKCKQHATTKRHEPPSCYYDDGVDTEELPKGAFINFTCPRYCNTCEKFERYSFSLNLSTIASDGRVCIVYKRYKYTSLSSLFQKLNEDGYSFRPNNQPSCYKCIDDEEIENKVVALITHPYRNPFEGNCKYTSRYPPPEISDSDSDSDSYSDSDSDSYSDSDDDDDEVPVPVPNGNKRTNCFQLVTDPKIAAIFYNGTAFDKQTIGRVYNYPESYWMRPPTGTRKYKSSFYRMVMTVMLCNSTERLPYLPSEMIEFILSFILVSDVSYDPISSSDYDLTTSNSLEVGRFLDALYA
jgi:hypothetical protein